MLESTGTLRRVGLIYLRLGQLEKSKATYAAANVRLEQAYAKFPSSEFRLEQARILNDLGNALWTDRQNKRARGKHLQALEIISSSIPDANADDEVLFELARTLYLCGRRNRGLGGGVREEIFNTKLPVASDEELGHVACASKILDKLADHQPDNHEIGYLRALCYREHADRSTAEHGELIDESLVESLRILETLSNFMPDDPKYRYAFCTTLQRCKIEPPASHEACRVVAKRIERSVEIAEGLVKQRPDEWPYAASHVESLIKLANVLNRADHLDEALVASRQAIDSSIELAAKFWDCEIFRLWVAHARRRRGDLLSPQLSQTDAALREYDSAIIVLNKLLECKQTGMELAILKNIHNAYVCRAEMLARKNLLVECDVANQQASEYLKLLNAAQATE